jgi:serine/threonine protein kinase
MLAEACEGLHALHDLRDVDDRSLDVIHRDIAPDNIMVTCSGEVKIVDFGTVKARHQHHATTVGTIKGKLAYLPPEVVSGREADSRADIWAMGVIAWELLTGKRLFRRDCEGATLEAVLGETIPRPSEVRSGLSAAFDEPVMRALQRERELRFPSARHFGRALRRAALTSGELVDAGDLQRWLMSALDHRHRCRRRAGGFPEQLDEDSVSESSDGAMNAVQEPNEAVALPIERSESRTLNWPRRESGMAVAVVAATLVGLVAGAVLVGSSEPASRANTTFATQALSGASSAAFTVPLRAEPIEGAVLEVRGGDGDVILHATVHELLAAELARRQEAPPAGDEP